MIGRILVLGAGSAGLLIALTLKRVMPWLDLSVVRSPELGVIGVGEGTTPYFRSHLLDFLRLDPNQFYAEAQPIWKLGGRFLWGPRPAFNYTFATMYEDRIRGLSRHPGFYCYETFDDLNLDSALMSQARACIRDANGWPVFSGAHAWHLENRKLVCWLENQIRALGVTVLDGTVAEVERQPDSDGLTALVLATGEKLTADFFVDASGFRAELLGRALGEPFHSYSGALFCDRAVIGGWSRRENEPILPYTTAETYDAGWCWRIDHEPIINRGYVYSSNFIGDDAARAEFLAKNPRLSEEQVETRVVRFRAGRYARSWVGNVVAIGNSAGFLEPLEATALTFIATSARLLADTLTESRLAPTPTLRDVFNDITARQWDGARDFLAVHYAFNTRLATPFWRHCCTQTPLGIAEAFMEFYRQNGPTALGRHALPESAPPYGYDGYLSIIVGQAVPFAAQHQTAPAERELLRHRSAELQAQAQSALTAREALALIRQPGFRWNAAPPIPSRFLSC